MRVGPITMAELNQALKDTANGKSPGVDSIPNEIWKLDGVFESLLSIVNECYKAAAVPQVWRRIQYSMVPKSSGMLTSEDNWRYIALMCTAAVSVIDEKLRYAQNGFRRYRGTLQHSLAPQHHPRRRAT